MNIPNIKSNLSRRTLVRTTLFLSFSVILIGAAISYYFLFYRVNKPLFSSSMPTPKPTVTPTPVYFPLINQPASYVGEVESIPSPTEIILLRDDGSRLVLTVKSHIPIYQVVNTPGQVPDIITKSVSTLQTGDILSIYASDQNITAIFLLNE